MRKITSTLGLVLRINNLTSKHKHMMYARVLIEVSVYGYFPNEIYFINELDELVSQKLVYDWKPTLCGKCKEFGHLKGSCRAGVQRKKAVNSLPNLQWMVWGQVKETGQWLWWTFKCKLRKLYPKTTMVKPKLNNLKTPPSP